MKKLELKVEWKTNEYYDMDMVTFLLTDEKIKTIEKAKKFMKDNPDIDTVRVRIDENCLESMSDYRLGYGFVLVSNAEALYFVGTDHYDSSNQVETESFILDE